MGTSGDILTRFFGASRSQGLSGGTDAVLDPSALGTPFARSLRRHRTSRDLVGAPEALWATGDGGGLREHVLAERAGGGRWSDLTVVVSAADARRAPAGWAAEVARLLEERHGAWARAEKVGLARPARVSVRVDGSAELGLELALEEGSYLTAITPTVHVPGPDSLPLLAVHACLPGVWSDYREVGRLHDDQALLTLGSHWLDTVRHPALREPCAWVLHRRADGGFVHQIAPTCSHRLTAQTDTDPSGASVITISTPEGEALAHLVLVELEPPAHLTRPRARKVERGPMRTVLADDVGVRGLVLEERGALLQRVHFGAFMDGYDVHVGDGGTVSTRMEHPRATIQVRGAGVSVVAHGLGVTFDGIPIPAHAPVPLHGPTTLAVDGHAVGWEPLGHVQAEGWPYLGALRRRGGGGACLPFGLHHRIGRDRRCAVRLPDEPYNGNIAWREGVGDGASIRSRTGPIPKTQFYIDSIMVASEHAELDLSGDAPLLRSLARKCSTFLRRGEEVIALHPREGGTGPTEHGLAPGDEIYVGNCIFEVQFSLRRPAVVGYTAPPVTIDVPTAGRLGELGPPPRPLRVTAAEADALEGPTSLSSAAEPLPAGKAPLAPEPAELSGANTLPLPDSRDTVPVPAELPPAPGASESDVIVMRTHEAAAELAGTARLVLEGWAIEEDLTVGNHRGATAMLPELADDPDALFLPTDTLLVRPAARGATHLQVLVGGETSLLVNGVEVEETEAGELATIQVVRRDENFEPRFAVVLCVLADLSLPGKRRLAVASTADAVGGLIVRSAPLGSWRWVRLGAVHVALCWDGEQLHVAGVKDVPLGVRRREGEWRLASGGRTQAAPGERVRVGEAIWRFELGATT